MEEGRELGKMEERRNYHDERQREVKVSGSGLVRSTYVYNISVSMVLSPPHLMCLIVIIWLFAVAHLIAAADAGAAGAAAAATATTLIAAFHSVTLPFHLS